MKETGKKKHIGIYIHHRNKQHWLKFKQLLPYFCARLTVISSLDIENEIGQDCDFLGLPIDHKKRMHLLYSFVYGECPDLFYVDDSVEIAAFIALLGVPYVFARNKDAPKNDLGHELAYGGSVFNIAPYENSSEEKWYKETPYYDKTKYYLKDRHEVNNKLFCMYLEEEFCLKKEEMLQPFFLKGF